MNLKNRIEYILKHNATIYSIYKVTISLFFKLVGMFIKTQDNLVLFTAQGKRFNDSPKAIYLYMLKHRITDKYQCVWAVNDPKAYVIPGNASVIVMDTWEYFKTALKAKYWICSVNIERGLQFKKKDTIFLNTWHCIPTNHMGNAVGTRRDFDWRKTNYICYSGNYEKPIIIRDCIAKEESLLPSGLPRNDELFCVSSETITSIRKHLNIPEGKKVVLYAPTWRDSTDLGKEYEIKPPINWDLWRKELSDSYILLIRTHPLTTKLYGINFDNNFIRDYSTYPDVNDLMIAADILISDYSSIIFDFAILERPIICYGYDYDKYVQHRGFYFDLDKEFPNGIIRSDCEVLDLITSMDYSEQCLLTKKMKSKFIEYGGHATEMCIEALFGKM